MADPYVKVWLMYKDKRVEKKKTVVMKRCLNPVFNESFIFDIPTEKLRETTIIITVMDKDRLSRNDVIGKVCPPPDSPRATALLGLRDGGAGHRGGRKVGSVSTEGKGLWEAKAGPSLASQRSAQRGTPRIFCIPTSGTGRGLERFHLKCLFQPYCHRPYAQVPRMHVGRGHALRA